MAGSLLRGYSLLLQHSIHKARCMQINTILQPPLPLVSRSCPTSTQKWYSNTVTLKTASSNNSKPPFFATNTNPSSADLRVLQLVDILATPGLHPGQHSNRSRIRFFATSSSLYVHAVCWCPCYIHEVLQAPLTSWTSTLSYCAHSKAPALFSPYSSTNILGQPTAQYPKKKIHNPANRLY